VSPYLIVIGGVFRKNSPKVFCVEHDQMHEKMELGLYGILMIPQCNRQLNDVVQRKSTVGWAA
jgi:hypothetical protein